MAAASWSQETLEPTLCFVLWCMRLQVRIHDVEGAPFFCFHHTNAYETSNGLHLVVDTCASNDMTFEVTDMAPESRWGNPQANSRVTRVVLDLQSGRVSPVCSWCIACL